MRTEVPVIKRCCFCLPLRYGLLAWGYFRLIISILIFTSLAASVYGSLSAVDGRYDTSDIVIIVIGFTLYLGEIILSSILIIAAHKKNQMLFKVYYIYSIFWWCIIFIYSIVNIGMVVDSIVSRGGFRSHHLVYLASDTALMVFNLFVQFYVILLLRSEIYKLNIVQFTFVNNATEAECKLKIDESYVVRGIDNDIIAKKNEIKDQKSNEH